MKSQIKIGNAGGFWGDDLGAFNRQLTGGRLDYITIDFLAEITMSILRKQQLKNPKAGYVTDFVKQIVDNVQLIKDKQVKIITNAGGINPAGCALKIIEELKSKQISLKIAVVEGDNIIDKLENLYPSKASFVNMETGGSFEQIKDRVQSANVYLGVLPIVKALELGAEIIIAGRVTDTSITMAPMIYEFGWNLKDWDKIAASLVAGHIIECGAQSTGGNFTDWETVETWENMGYPIIEAYPDGTFVITKHPDTGGMVNLNTVKEQLVYEMGNPANYISPDVVVDFRSIRLQQDGENRVKVSGIKGKASTKTFKVSMAYHDGYKSTSSIIICGEQALEKAQKFAEIFWKRLNVSFMKQNTEYVGYNSCHLSLAKKIAPNEILLRLSVFDPDTEKIDAFSKSIAPLILSGPPGVAVTGGRPQAQEVMTYYPCLIQKSLIEAEVKLFDNDGNIAQSLIIQSVTGFEADLDSTPLFIDPEKKNKELGKNGYKQTSLRNICLARSGDKGDMVNIGVIARSELSYNFLKEVLSQEFIKELFKDLCKGKVERYELDNLMALNFLLDESLDGGGTKSLRFDAQGKTFASALLNHLMDIPVEVLDSVHY